MPRKSVRFLEWLLLALVISIILIAAASQYGRLARDVQRLSFELVARHFQTAVSGARAQWYIERSRGRPASDAVLVSELLGAGGDGGEGEARVYLNTEGWPVNTDSRRRARDNRQTPAECLQLWRALLQEPPPATVRQPPEPDARYQVQLGEEGQCRYRRLSDGKDRQYFDYWPETGRVASHPPRP